MTHRSGSVHFFLNRTRGVKVQQVRADRRADDTHGQERIAREVVIRERWDKSCCDTVEGRLQPPCRDHEGDGHDAKQADAVLDDREVSEPDDQPGGQADRQDPPLKSDARQQFDRDCDAADFRRQQQDVDHQLGAERNHLVVEPKPLPHRRRHRAFTDRRDSSRHLREHRQDERGQSNCPEQRESELRASLCGG